MRKFADSALGAVRLDKVQPEKSIDLGDTDVIRQARVRRMRAEYTDRVQLELGRLTARVSRLQRKAARLPLRSNGRAKCMAEAHQLQALAMVLPLALDGKHPPKLPHVGGRHAGRAIELANTLAAVAA